MSSENRKLEIFVVDDNRADIRLIQAYFEDERMVPHNLNFVSDGVEAIKLLEKKGKYHDYPQPDIILLDLYMPIMGGREVLKNVRNNNDYKNIVVCIMTSNVDEAESLNLHALPASFYILKPVDVDKFLSLLEKAISYLSEDLQDILK